MRFFNFSDILKFAQVDISQLHQGHATTAEDDLTFFIPYGGKILNCVPIGGRTRYLIFSRFYKPALHFVK